MLQSAVQQKRGKDKKINNENSGHEVVFFWLINYFCGWFRLALDRLIHWDLSTKVTAVTIICQIFLIA